MTLQDFTHMVKCTVVSLVFYNLGDNPLPPPQCFYEADPVNGLWEKLVAVKIDGAHQLAVHIHGEVRRIMNNYYNTLSAEEREIECSTHMFFPAESGEPDADFDFDSFVNSWI